jgi:hypothetical protein
MKLKYLQAQWQDLEMIETTQARRGKQRRHSNIKGVMSFKVTINSFGP